MNAEPGRAFARSFASGVPAVPAMQREVRPWLAFGELLERAGIDRACLALAEALTRSVIVPLVRSLYSWSTASADQLAGALAHGDDLAGEIIVIGDEA